MNKNVKKQISLMMAAGLLSVSALGTFILPSTPSFATENISKTFTSSVLFMAEPISYDVSPAVVEGITMLPLKATAEKLGFKVTWDAKTYRVEVSKGAQWTSVTIDQNAYFKNKMAPAPLSNAPILVKDRTLVPIEFFTNILNMNIVSEEGKVTFNDGESAVHEGYIQKVEKTEFGVSIYLATTEKTDKMEEMVVVHVKPETIVNAKLVVGQYVLAHCTPIMTMSIPGQTSADLIYQINK